MSGDGVSVVIPTYRREEVLVDTVARMLPQLRHGDELLVIDQTSDHRADTRAALERWSRDGAIRWIEQQPPSITRAMNRGLREARCDVVLFVDDDVDPSASLVDGHRRAHREWPGCAVAGQIIQPWERALDPDQPAWPEGTTRDPDAFRFNSARPCATERMVGCNMSVARGHALAIGGFDENFAGVAYRFEAEFAARWLRSGATIRFAPEASVNHLKVASGGTRALGDFLRSWSPVHAVGAYYYLLRIRPPRWLATFVLRPWRSIATRHHLRRPWWIVPSLVAEYTAVVWAIGLCLRGPSLAGLGDDA